MFQNKSKKFIGNKSITTNIYVIQANNSMTMDTFVLDLLNLC